MRLIRRLATASPTALALAFALASGGCASGPAPAPALACARGQRAMAVEWLYFGSAMPQGVVSPDDWRGFVDAVVTPRSPDGLTAWPAAGQWRSPGGTVVREASWMLNIVHVADEPSNAAITDIVAVYKTRFHQDSVLRVTTPACVAF